jgi:hypothetical protein
VISKNLGAASWSGKEPGPQPDREPLDSCKAAGFCNNWLRTPALAIGALWLCFIWHRNYDLLGDFYDYSIVTSAAGYLDHGLKVYRDFSSPLQSLTIYLCWFAELVFGHRYLALGYANLTIGLAGYFILARALKNRLPPLLDVLTAAAFCVCTVFQHGIVWYNSIAILLLALIVICSVTLYGEEQIRPGIIIVLCALLFLSSMCKLNFHLLACAIVGGILLLRGIKLGWPKKWLALIPLLFVCGAVLGPLLEIVVNGTTLREFFYDVVRTPAGRVHLAREFSNPNLFLGKFWDFYPYNWSAGIYLKAALIYVISGFLAFSQSSAEGADVRGEGLLRSKFLAPAGLASFLLASMALTVSNVETQMLTSAFMLIGLSAVFVMFRSELCGVAGGEFKAGIFLLAAFYFIAGSESAFMHSRIYYGQPALTQTQPGSAQELERAQGLTYDQIPVYDGSSISPKLAGYFSGVRFTEIGRARLRKIFSFIEANHLDGRLQNVYWGPGLEILNRLEGNIPKGRFPLWYHGGATLRAADGPPLLREFKRSNYEWVISTDAISEMPQEVHDYIFSNYDRSGDEDILFFHRKS